MHILVTNDFAQLMVGWIHLFDPTGTDTSIGNVVDSSVSVIIGVRVGGVMDSPSFNGILGDGSPRMFSAATSESIHSLNDIFNF